MYVNKAQALVHLHKAQEQMGIAAQELREEGGWGSLSGNTFDMMFGLNSTLDALVAMLEEAEGVL